MSDFPLCRARGVITETQAGPRVSMSSLWAALDGPERCAWYAQARTYTADSSGLLPAEVEEFLGGVGRLVRLLVDDQGRPAFPGYQQRAMFDRGEQIAP